MQPPPENWSLPPVAVGAAEVIKPSKPSEQSRVGKGRPAGTIELRVFPSPSKIPYGGFSPVRLQMDRQWRPSTTSRGLSAVHIRPMTPSYTPPQFSLPGIRDPQGDYPFESLSVQYGTTPSNSNTSSQRPLARQRVLLSGRVIAYYGLIRDSESLPATYEFAAESAVPKQASDPGGGGTRLSRSGGRCSGRSLA